MKAERVLVAVLLAAGICAGGAFAQEAKKVAKAPSIAKGKGAKGAETLPVTTLSRAAARYFESGMVEYEKHRWNLALDDWHKAVKLDPQFALAHTWICMTTVEPAEESRSRARAKASMGRASAGEQMLVRWMAGTHENRYVEGISAMNDVLAMYPRDKRLNFLIAYWLYKQDQYDPAEKLTLRALAEDANYATAYNQLSYIYSRRGEYAKAIEASGRYVELLPGEPNPHDSYGEMLRLSGRFEEALEHYRTALKIDPTFYISQKELGETYALMGDEERSRLEYAKAIEQAPSNGVKAEYLQKSAMTYLREKRYDEADKAFAAAAEKAHAMEQWVWEARAHRIMAMYQRDAAAAAKELGRAEAILSAKKGVLARSDVDEEEARILRVRVEHAAADGDLAAAGKGVKALERMASAGGGVSIERTYHGAAGTLLAAEGKYAEAVAHLEEDFTNPISMKVLVSAYEKSGAGEQAKALQKKLGEWRIPTIEEALVVPGPRRQESAATSPK
jgi:tetratricopeptide (TPR) repeat protein